MAQPVDAGSSMQPLAKGITIYSGSLRLIASLNSGGKSFVYQRHQRRWGEAVVRCADYSCSACVRALGYESAKCSTDPIVKAAGELAAKQVQDQLLAKTICVVTEARLTHAPTCRSPPQLSLDDLAKMPDVQRLVVESRSHDTVMEAVRLKTGVVLAAADVTRLGQHVSKIITETREKEYRLLHPLLVAMERNEGFGAELVVKKADGATATVAYGSLKAPNVAHLPNPQLEGARIVHVVVLWPWARAVEDLGPLIAGADAMHSKAKQGFIFNVSMRVAKHNVSLLTMWSASENTAAWSLLLARAKTHLCKLLKPGTSLITDRGTALLAAMLAHPGVQHLFDRPHLIRNVVFNFPELNKIECDLRKLLDNVLYARNSQQLDDALDALMAEWIKAKPAPKPNEEDEPPRVPTDDDSDSDSDSPLDKNTKPRTYIQRQKGQTPRSYIESIGTSKFCVALMASNNFDVPSANSAEAQGFLYMDARYMTPAQAITSIFATHLRFFSETAAELKGLKNSTLILFPCWPFHERFNAEMESVQDYKYTKTTDTSGVVSYVGALRGVQFTTAHNVRFDADAPVNSSEAWSVLPRRGHSCDAGCYKPQVLGAPCVHIMRALRDMFPGHTGTRGARLSDRDLETERAEDARRYKEALLSITAEYYQVEWMLVRMSALVEPGRFFLPNLADLPRGPKLLPIMDEPAPSPIKFAGGGGRPGHVEARIPSQGEAELLQAAAGPGVKRRKRATKNSCSLCKERGLSGVGHTKRNPNCPVKLELQAGGAVGAAAAGAAAAGAAADGAAADGAAADGAAVAGAAAVGGSGIGAAGAATDVEDEDEEESGEEGSDSDGE